MKKTLLLFLATIGLGLETNAASIRVSTENLSDNPTGENSDTPEGLILTAPDGETKTYYMDLLTHDEAVGFIGDYHNKVKIIFCENGEVYVPNAVYRNTIKGLMRGQLNAEKDTITFSNNMIVGWGPNQKKYYYVKLTDNGGHIIARDNFKMAIDKATGKITCADENLYLSLFFGDDVQQTYGIGANFAYTPVEYVDNRLDSYNFFYADSDDDKATHEVKVKAYFEGEDFYIKGMNPKYPNAWMKGVLKDGKTVQFLSRQMANLLKTDDPIVMLATSPKDDDGFNIHAGFELEISADKTTLTGLNDGKIFMSNVAIDEDLNKTLLRSYKMFTLKLSPLSPATPKAPEFQKYSSDEQEFTFILPSEGTDGTKLDTDFMTYRIFVNGEPYTFKKSLYPRLRNDEDLSVIPFIFDDYNTISKSGYKRYVYFKGLDANTETLAVEATYSVKGESHTSDRLIYNLKTGEHGVVTGISTPESLEKPKSTVYYDLSGRKFSRQEKGICIKVTTYGNGKSKVSKVML